MAERRETSQALHEHSMSLIILGITTGAKCTDKTTKLLSLYQGSPFSHPLLSLSNTIILGDGEYSWKHLE